jgi:gliding motility-associated-like protein
VKWNDVPLTDTVYCVKSDTLEVGTYEIKVTTENNGYISESNYVNCVQPEPPTIVIPNVFTPNSDGRNDLFVIRNLTLYSHRPLTISNRWGKVVYQSSQYNNDWDGSNVPDGVYFGVVEININNQIVSFTINVTILHGR